MDSSTHDSSTLSTCARDEGHEYACVQCVVDLTDNHIVGRPLFRCILKGHTYYTIYFNLYMHIITNQIYEEATSNPSMQGC